MQLKPPPAPADETMQLRLPEPGAFDIPQDQSKPGAGGRGRRKAPRPSVLARFSAVAGSRLAPFVPFARQLRPQYPRPGRNDWRRWVPSWRQSLGAAGLAVGASGMFLTVAYAATDIPDDLNTFATQQDNVYFWSDGTPMARTGWVRRQAMPLKDVPEDVRWAVLAAENASFYSDPGISVSGITRALVRTVGEGDTQGGSTITQQYVKNVYLSQDRSLGRKFDEAMIALKLDNKMSKDKILEGYLNTSWFGRGTYGIQRASQAYYGKDVSDLNVSEAAVLSSLLKGAGLYDPSLSKANHERTVERWEWILDRMVSIGKLSKAERAKYTKFPEPIEQANQYDTGKQSDYLVRLASQYAKKATNLTDQEFDRGGYQIYTTFDKDRQTELTDAVTKARKAVRKDSPKKAKDAHFGASSVDADGRILAVYGGPDHREQGYNESNATTVPSGSAFLPFVYAAGLEHGVVKERGGEATPVTPATVYDGNDAVPVTTPEGPYWDRDGDQVSAHNDGKKSWGPITLHDALAGSVNTPFMQLGMDTGLDKVRATAEAAGLLSSSLGAQVPALSVGSATPSAIRMASGYSTFAARGKHTEPYSVRKVTHNGSRVALNNPKPKRAVGVGVAAEVTSALTDAFRADHPTSPGAASFEVAAKGGTTQDDRAAWYVGTAQDVSTAVVVYRIDLARSLEPLPLDGIAGTPNSGVPYDIWSSAMSIG
ncbi:transglycosylase domain-containing protein [Streptomyces europaeiscabiei]|uniref:transglycosylase domain-containing protein n=1 Tax=Streptomyces europaeiscabiei TaxID=146819 RepID=UPI0029AF31C3|nr:transglycosylase domain-containing protein [Streptomyces europaeiscabiei]MDX3864727.1 transglycosylase domain-containing protein [Streptomyces europaeiscabiei]